ncbi:hypothetical protein KY290_008556 [Solanum tuberosum]|uniref:Thioredoxin domain-containing protein n=1 Tax=Solanum tuberosum TaxID=4113 RepID=A0ABQ7W8U9_SOLTU|nr:hypothetical protein KY290_008556 [Solanum tuberosum]
MAPIPYSCCSFVVHLDKREGHGMMKWWVCLGYTGMTKLSNVSSICFPDLNDNQLGQKSLKGMLVTWFKAIITVSVLSSIGHSTVSNAHEESSWSNAGKSKAHYNVAEDDPHPPPLPCIGRKLCYSPTPNSKPQVYQLAHHAYEVKQAIFKTHSSPNLGNPPCMNVACLFTASSGILPISSKGIISLRSSVLLILKPFFSKNLGTLWDDLGKTMEGEDEIEVGQVDCGTDKPVCNKADIHSYPTFKLFYNGEEVAKYQGPRDIESLKVFALEEVEKAATKAEADDDKEL